MRTDPIRLAQNHPIDPSLPRPRESLRVPAIGDIDHDLDAEIVATAGEHVYAWNLDGSRVPGFPVRVDPALSDPCNPGAPHPCFDAADRQLTEDNHLKRGFIGSPALADLDGDRQLDIVAGALDQHLYAWDGERRPAARVPREAVEPRRGRRGDRHLARRSPSSTGSARARWSSPRTRSSPATRSPRGASSTSSTPSSAPAPARTPCTRCTATGAWSTAGRSTSGCWRATCCRWSCPGTTPRSSTSTATATTRSRSPRRPRSPARGRSSSTATGRPSAPSRLRPRTVPIRARWSTSPTTRRSATSPGTARPDVVKGGLTLNGVANLLAVNQNLPFCHVEQAWNPATGAALPGYPRATDDFQLLSQASIARVAGGGPQRQALVGTGLYQLHAYGPTGGEAPGWPKFTGGWTQSTPAVGDADGDGKLDVAARDARGLVVPVENAASPRAAAPTTSGGPSTTTSTAPPSTGRRAPARHSRGPWPPGATRAGPVGVSWRQPGDDWLCGSARPLPGDRLQQPDRRPRAMER